MKQKLKDKYINLKQRKQAIDVKLGLVSINTKNEGIINNTEKILDSNEEKLEQIQDQIAADTFLINREKDIVNETELKKLEAKYIDVNDNDSLNEESKVAGKSLIKKRRLNKKTN